MMTAERLQTQTASLADLFEKKLKLRGRGLDAKLRRAGGRVPAWVRAEAGKFVRAEALVGHPRLAMQLDAAGLDAAYVRIERWLDGVDLKARRRDRLLHLAAVNAFNLLFVTVAFLAWMVWSGHL